MRESFEYERQDMEFDADGTRLRGWLYQPRKMGPSACVVLSGGFATVKEMTLDQYASHFAKQGLCALVFDHRGFGASDGLPRQEINPWQQIEDYKHAITFAANHPAIDPERIGIWGSSYSGGHVLVVAGSDRRVKAVVSQVPTISAYQSALRRVPAEAVPALLQAFADDRSARQAGKEAAVRAVVPDGSGRAAIYNSQDSIDYFLAPSFREFFRNEVTLRSVEWSRSYEPGLFIKRISPTPLLMIVADRDLATPSDLALAAYEDALQPKQLVLIRGGHYSVYTTELDRVSRLAADWFSEHL